MIEITHTIEDGTLVDGTAKGDGSAAILKAHRFRWSRNLSLWHRPKSRGSIANRYRIDQAAEALRAAGFEVEVSIDNTAVDPAQREQARSARAEQRADALDDKAQRYSAAADAAHTAAHDAVAGIPFGQPILVGHHSEKRHRAALDRSDRAMRRAIDECATARDAERRADAARSADRHRQTPTYIGNRIEEKQARERAIGRTLAGYEHAAELTPAAEQRRDDLLAEREQLRTDLAHHREQLAELEAAGTKLWGPDDFEKDDRVRIKGRWGTVVRVNKKTLSVACDVMPQFPHRYLYTEVQEKGERPAEQAA